MTTPAPYKELDSEFPDRPFVMAGQICRVRKRGIWVIVTLPNGVEMDFVGTKWPEIAPEVERVLALNPASGVNGRKASS